MTSDSLQGSVKKLGEELRDIRVGAQAPVEQVEADLRIKAKYIIAMEEGDITSLPARVYTEGFVRNYAIYLGLDPTGASRRFFEEHGLAAPSETRKPTKIAATSSSSSSSLERIAPQQSGPSFGRGLVALWPLVLIGGLGFGLYKGYGAAHEAGLLPESVTALTAPSEEKEAPATPVPESKSAKAETQVLIGEGKDDEARPDTLSYARADATPYWQAPPPEVEPVDGPVSEIKEDEAGVIPRPAKWTDTKTAAQATSGADASRIAAEALEALNATLDPDVTSEIADATASQAYLSETDETIITQQPGVPRRFALHASADSWIKIQDATGVTVFTGILNAGEIYNIPNDVGLTLRTGNAGGLMIEVDGQHFGPLGNSGAVMNNVPLNPGAIRASFMLDRRAQLLQ